MDLPSFMGNPLFSVYSLTAVLNRVPFLPGLIGRQNLFSPRPLLTNVAMIEARNSRLALVPEQPRGAPANRNVMGERGVLPFLIPHFPLSDTLMADSILGVRAFGTENQLEAFSDVLNARIESMSQKHDVTLEHLRLGAIKGIVITIVNRETGAIERTVNLFEMFGIPQPPVWDWPIVHAPGGITEADAWSAPIRALITEMQRRMARELGGAPLGGIACICGSVFFDAVATAPERRQTFLNTAEAGLLRASTFDLAIPYAGCLFQEYMGGVGDYVFVEPDMAYFYPLNVPELFIECYAPAPYIETVNTLALRRYSKQQVLDFDKGIEIETQQNVLPLCTMPSVLVSARAVPAAGGASGAAAATTRQPPPMPAGALRNNNSR